MKIMQFEYFTIYNVKQSQTAVFMGPVSMA